MALPWEARRRERRLVHRSRGDRVHPARARVRLGVEPPPEPEGGAVRDIVALLTSAQRPAILAGGGVVAAGAQDDLVRLSELAELPVLAAWRRPTAFPNDHPHYLGVTGYGAAAKGSTLVNYAGIDRWIRGQAKLASEQGFELGSLLQLLRICRKVAIEKEGWQSEQFGEVASSRVRPRVMSSRIRSVTTAIGGSVNSRQARLASSSNRDASASARSSGPCVI